MTHPLAALIAGVKVKPLVWEAGERDQRRADSILGEFCVTFFGGRWFYQGEPCNGMLDAQAAAQADYEARIMAALEVAHHVNETPKSEHDGADVLTDAAQAREATFRDGWGFAYRQWQATGSVPDPDYKPSTEART